MSFSEKFTKTGIPRWAFVVSTHQFGIRDWVGVGLVYGAMGMMLAFTNRRLGVSLTTFFKYWIGAFLVISPPPLLKILSKGITWALQKIATLATQEEKNQWLLHECSYGTTQGVTQALAVGANLSATDTEGNNVFHLACLRSSLELLNLMYQHAAHKCSSYTLMNASNNEGNPPLFLLIKNHRYWNKDHNNQEKKSWILDFINTLMKDNCKNNHGQNALHLVVRYYAADPDLITALLTRDRVDLNAEDDRHKTPTDDCIQEALCGGATFMPGLFCLLRNKGTMHEQEARSLSSLYKDLSNTYGQNADPKKYCVEYSRKPGDRCGSPRFRLDIKWAPRGT